MIHGEMSHTKNDHSTVAPTPISRAGMSSISRMEERDADHGGEHEAAQERQRHQGREDGFPLHDPVSVSQSDGTHREFTGWGRKSFLISMTTT